MRIDVEKFIEGLHDYIGRAFAPIAKRLDALESRELGPVEPPRNGKDADIADLIPAMEAEITKRLAELPHPKDGEDGKSVSVDDVLLMVADQVQKAVESLPPAKDGASVTLDDVQPLVDQAVKAIPAPAPGKDADPETIREMVQRAVEAIPAPKDGTSITAEDIRPILEHEVSKWALDFERRAQGILERAIERMPKPKDGVDGNHGLGWDDMTVEHDGKRGISLIFTKGEVRHVAELVIPCVIDAGFYRDGMVCEKGDGVTFGGSYWIAQKDTKTKPEVGNEDWRLAVRKGRDGKDADRVKDSTPRQPMKVN